MVRPKKYLGQHFLNDDNIARKIVGSLSPGTRRVVEIGAGTGVLSRHLLANPGLDPLFFEIDTESVEYLKLNFPGIAARLIEADFLEYDLSLVTAPFTVIGNFPYNISSQILFRILEFRNSVPEVVGMFQKEVAERIASPPGSKKYGILSVLLQTWYEIEYLFTVNEHVFIPPPKVKSGVIRLRRNTVTYPGCDEKTLFAVVKTAFNQRRKTLRNSLKGIVDEKSPEIAGLLGKRAEQLNVSDFVLLANAAKSSE